MQWRCVAAIPLPPKKTVAEHTATQAEFLEQKLEPALAEARAGVAHLFFVDAAHFVMGSFLCCVWCRVRLMIRGASGRTHTASEAKLVWHPQGDSRYDDALW